MMECQSCGMPMENPEDHADADVGSEFCHYCMVKGEFVVKDAASMKDHMAEMYMQQMGVSREEAEAKAETTLKGLRRWQ